MSKFTHAGVSKQNGEFKVRFANDALRTKVLMKNGHDHVDIIELREPMTKEDAVAYLLSIKFYEKNGKVNGEVKAALEGAQTKRAPKAPKAAVKSKPTMDAIKAKAKATTAKAKATTAKAKMVTPIEVPAATAVVSEDAPY
jgi:antitoxin component YwqK of YwqJK toxin-antitoxin module